MSTLSDDEVESALEGLDGWARDGDALVRSYRFEDFRAAISFMGTAAGAIDEMDHHPEWTNVYDRVEVRLTSHDAGGITDCDVQLARVLDRLA